MGISKIKIGIIGAGETGVHVMELLLNAPFVELVGIADINEDAPGLAMAKEKGVDTYFDFLDLAEKGDQVDILVDVTGVGIVRDQLRRHMQESHNHHTIIMHEQLALLMVSLAKGEPLVQKHGPMDY